MSDWCQSFASTRRTNPLPEYRRDKEEAAAEHCVKSLSVDPRENNNLARVWVRACVPRLRDPCVVTCARVTVAWVWMQGGDRGE